jgi:hypothetical protein
MSVLIPSISALAGIIIGSWLTHFLSAYREQRSHLRHQRSKVYSEFIESFTASALVNDAEELKVSDRRIASLRTQIALIGSDETLTSLGALFNHRDFASGEGEEALMRLIANMRADVLARRSRSGIDLVKLSVHGR